MASPDPTVRLSVTIPSSLHDELEQVLAAGETGIANRSQVVTEALRSWLADRRDRLLRVQAARLDADDDEDDAVYHALQDQR